MNNSFDFDHIEDTDYCRCQWCEDGRRDEAELLAEEEYWREEE